MTSTSRTPRPPRGVTLPLRSSPTGTGFAPQRRQHEGCGSRSARRVDVGLRGASRPADRCHNSRAARTSGRTFHCDRSRGAVGPAERPGGKLQPVPARGRETARPLAGMERRGLRPGAQARSTDLSSTSARSGATGATRWTASRTRMPAIAALINELFIPVKVDRDVRPDIDTRYQAAVAELAGSGGWPLTVFLTPDGNVFYGATYLPPETLQGGAAPGGAGLPEGSRAHRIHGRGTPPARGRPVGGKAATLVGRGHAGRRRPHPPQLRCRRGRIRQRAEISHEQRRLRC